MILDYILLGFPMLPCRSAILFTLILNDTWSGDSQDILLTQW